MMEQILNVPETGYNQNRMHLIFLLYLNPKCYFNYKLLITNAIYHKSLIMYLSRLVPLICVTNDLSYTFMSQINTCNKYFFIARSIWIILFLFFRPNEIPIETTSDGGKLLCPAPISRLRVEKIEGGLMVAGVVVAANCQIILPIFGFLFLLVGCVLTGEFFSRQFFETISHISGKFCFESFFHEKSKTMISKTWNSSKSSSSKNYNFISYDCLLLCNILMSFKVAAG